ncbi:MAG: hypothetical protein D6E12_01865 [Desulfovibrio sp.]|nr:MAG: hypothetical protein D6E12_01865 [Desulfovibrio sp.]
MIDKTAIIPVLEQKLKVMPVGHGLDMRTYKRNRSLVFVKLDPEHVDVIQNGYEQATYRHIELSKLRKLLKTLLKKEFPRSTKVRLYSLGEFSDEQADVKRKTI